MKPIPVISFETCNVLTGDLRRTDEWRQCLFLHVVHSFQAGSQEEDREQHDAVAGAWLQQPRNVAISAQQ